MSQGITGGDLLFNGGLLFAMGATATSEMLVLRHENNKNITCQLTENVAKLIFVSLSMLSFASLIDKSKIHPLFKAPFVFYAISVCATNLVEITVHEKSGDQMVGASNIDEYDNER